MTDVEYLFFHYKNKTKAKQNIWQNYDKMSQQIKLNDNVRDRQMVIWNVKFYWMICSIWENPNCSSWLVKVSPAAQNLSCSKADLLTWPLE